MYKNLFVGVGMLLALPSLVFAHETRQYEIGGVPYEIVVGSLGEPVIVDDKTGVDLEIVRNGTLLGGAQESLQVELLAGDASRVVNLSPVYGAVGRYKSNFIATVPTTITYRLFGELEGMPIDLSFSCNPAGHPQVEEDTREVEISEGVVQTLKRGAFGCPQEKEAFGFPEIAPSLYTLEQKVSSVGDKQEKRSTDPVALAALMVAVLAGGFAFRAHSKK
jgi:hypothetical protein